MKAMILAAGRGERMRPLTLRTPKPLLKAGGRALIDYHIDRLREAGFRELVINHSWLGEQICEHVQKTSPPDLEIRFSEEASPLETAGGIRHALPLLDGEGDWFALVNGDIWTDFDFSLLKPPAGGDALLVLVDNPSHNRDGDFDLAADGRVLDQPGSYTFSGISLINRRLLETGAPDEPRLGPLLRDAARRGQVRGLHHKGAWFDVGTPQRLAELDAFLGASNSKLSAKP